MPLTKILVVRDMKPSSRLVHNTMALFSTYLVHLKHEIDAWTIQRDLMGLFEHDVPI